MKKLLTISIGLLFLSGISFSNQTIDSLKITDQSKSIDELKAALAQTIEENEVKVSQNPKEKARELVYIRYTEFIGTELEPILIQAFTENPNFVIKDIKYFGDEVFINGKSVFLQANKDVKRRIDLFNDNPTVMANYRKILRTHKNITKQVSDYLISFDLPESIAKKYEGSIPVKCQHSVSYIAKQGFLQLYPEMDLKSLVADVYLKLWTPVGSFCEQTKEEELYSKVTLSKEQAANFLSYFFFKYGDDTLKTPVVDNEIWLLWLGDAVYYELDEVPNQYKDIVNQKIADFKKQNTCVPSSKLVLRVSTESMTKLLNRYLDGYTGDYKPGVHFLKKFKIPSEYKCEETLATVSRYFKP